MPLLLSASLTARAESEHHASYKAYLLALREQERKEEEEIARTKRVPPVKIDFHRTKHFDFGMEQEQEPWQSTSRQDFHPHQGHSRERQSVPLGRCTTLSLVS